MSDLVHRLRERARIRRAIQSRKSVQEGKPDRIADLLDEAATEIERLTVETGDGCPIHCNNPDTDKCFDCFCIARERREIEAYEARSRFQV